MKKSILNLGLVGLLALSVPAFAQKAPEPAKPAEAAKPAEPAKPAAATPAPAAPAAAPKAAEAAKPKPVIIPKGIFYKGQSATQYMAKTRLIGAKVTNKAGEVIGDIEDLIITVGGNDVVGVVMGVGGFLGVGEKKIGVQMDALQMIVKDGKRVPTIDVSKEVLAAVPAFTYGEAPKTMVQKAGEAAKKAADATKEAAKKASDATKGAVEKAKEAVKKPAQ
jgi:sporulation protein YlmC with PRC-barrel domain